MKNILVGATGSVASLKLPFLIEALKETECLDAKTEVCIF